MSNQMLSNMTTRTEMMSVRLPHRLVAELRAMAAERRLPVGKVIEQAVADATATRQAKVSNCTPNRRAE